jgi:predicted HTH domain antitoxin
MNVAVPDDLVRSAGLTETGLVVEMALLLYGQERLTIEQAARFARMDRMEFLNLLASRDIPLTLDVDDLEEDIATLRRLGRL